MKLHDWIFLHNWTRFIKSWHEALVQVTAQIIIYYCLTYILDLTFYLGLNCSNLFTCNPLLDPSSANQDVERAGHIIWPSISYHSTLCHSLISDCFFLTTMKLLKPGCDMVFRYWMKVIRPAITFLHMLSHNMQEELHVANSPSFLLNVCKIQKDIMYNSVFLLFPRPVLVKTF